MAMDSGTSSRLYLEKAVQTDAYTHFSEPALVQTYSESATNVSQLMLPECETTANGSVYEHAAPQFSAVSKRQYNLGHNHGFLAVSKTQQRVISFPEPALSHTPPLEQKHRVVSMPEGDFQSALENKDFLEGKNLTSHVNSRVKWPYPLDLPQTPSPPSSPDSVLIIGNESHVPASILRHYEEAHGWISWAHSPPRPIPALHGPLSLPYARCPSGAEGTVLEGDDFSQKVWGLGPDEHHGQMRSKVPPTSATAIHRFEEPRLQERSRPGPPVLTPAIRNKDIIIDLARPSTFRTCPEPSGPQASSNHSLRVFRGDLPGDLPPNKVRARVIDLSRDHIDSKSDRTTGGAGLGLNWQTLMQAAGMSSQASQTHLSQRSGLNTAAPVFVPTVSRPQRSYDIAYNQLPSSQYQFDTRRATNPPSVPVYQSIQDLPTPPNTASPHWSPIFNATGTSEATEPYIYSPQTDLDSYSTHLLALMHRMNEQERFNSIQDHLNTARLSHLTVSPLVDNQKDRRLPAAHGQGLASHQPSVATQVASVEPVEGLQAHHRLSYQQPRSIPLAKLIQRRLSSVTEEEITNFTNRLSHPSTCEPRSRVASASSTRSECGTSEAEPRASRDSKAWLHAHPGDGSHVDERKSPDVRQIREALDVSVGKEDGQMSENKQSRNKSSAKRKPRSGKAGGH